MIVLGPAGTLYPGSSQDYRFFSNREWTLATGTRWIRLWADWPTLMPARGQFDTARLAALDAQIAQAKTDGLKVILTIFRFPTWANGVDAMSAGQLAATMPDRRKATQSDAKAKTVLMRYPDDVSATSDWAAFFRFLASRYSVNKVHRPVPAATVDAIEIANEPNLTWWPQQAPSVTTDPYAQSEIVIHRVIARMLQTAGAIVATMGNSPRVAGPATHDGDVVDRLQTHYGSYERHAADEPGGGGPRAAGRPLAGVADQRPREARRVPHRGRRDAVEHRVALRHHRSGRATGQAGRPHPAQLGAHGARRGGGGRHRRLRRGGRGDAPGLRRVERAPLEPVGRRRA
jgi:hypothetical protein